MSEETLSTRSPRTGSKARSSTRTTTRSSTTRAWTSPRSSGARRASGSIGSSPTPGQEHQLRVSRRLDQMVRGRHAQRGGELHRPPSEETRAPGRHHLGARRPGRGATHITYGELYGEVRTFANVLKAMGVKQRRPRHHLSADDPGSRLRHARLRAHRGDPFRGVRRLLAGLARGPHHRLQVEAHRHRR